MTLAQIAAILGLLYAFGVDQPTVNNISQILTADMPSNTIASSTPIFGSTPDTSGSQPVQNGQTQQTNGNTIQSVADKSAINISTTIQDESQTGMPYGSFRVSVVVLDSKGNPVKGAAVHFVGQNNIYPVDGSNPDTDTNINRTTNIQTYPIVKGSQSSVGEGDWHTGFDYVPTSNGTKTLTVTSGSLTESVSIDVQ